MQLIVPGTGCENSAKDTHGSKTMNQSTRLGGTFPWGLPEFTLSSMAARQLSQASKDDVKPHGSTTPRDIDRGSEAGDEAGHGIWETVISVSPSKAARDGIHFRGLGVLLYVAEEERLSEEGVRLRVI